MTTVAVSIARISTEGTRKRR